MTEQYTIQCNIVSITFIDHQIESTLIRQNHLDTSEPLTLTGKLKVKLERILL